MLLCYMNNEAERSGCDWCRIRMKRFALASPPNVFLRHFISVRGVSVCSTQRVSTSVECENEQAIFILYH
ncbi:unnamed protein product [Amoebophrya sp. A25]|nr:unnamed protein product [Amoebophrya sp. A25]|eukprot:GSA25T00020534001.1